MLKQNAVIHIFNTRGASGFSLSSPCITSSKVKNNLNFPVNGRSIRITQNDVITPPNSFISSTSAIVHIGAKPVFVDVLDDQNINPALIEKAITKKTKAIMPVHLTGRIAEMNEIMRISKKYGI